ncbi:hypothetical protein OM416_20555 [Paenibacillus sp. LS1]|uniref:hypothetical protein n=1 Tax=Paenibacillus sp. LS1 TaxID=2992120 RepID=UPI00222FD506|nr:hypothetical protein [Paenibacillus sp. LS1]MCW3793990.1 hypothetical protein [Paenibacillus sp. LS1]
MSNDLIEHKLIKYQFYAVLFLVSVFYIWWVDDVQYLFEIIPWIRWIPLLVLFICGITYLFTALKMKSEINLVDALSMIHSTILKEKREVEYMQIVEHGSGTFSIVVTYNKDLKEEFKVNRKKIISRLKV